MKKDNTIFFEYKATLIDKEDLDEEIIEKEVHRTLKAYFLDGFNKNFDELPFKIKIESKINEDYKVETNYILKLVIMNQDVFDELMERQEKLGMLLKQRVKKSKYEEDDWVSNKRIH